MPNTTTISTPKPVREKTQEKEGESQAHTECILTQFSPVDTFEAAKRLAARRGIFSDAQSRPPKSWFPSPSPSTQQQPQKTSSTHKLDKRLGGPTSMVRGEKRPAPQDCTVDYDLPVSLEEIYTGVTKKRTITRWVLL